VFANVLEGSVRKAGKRIRVTGQLIDASTTRTSGRMKFDGELETSSIYRTA